MKYKSIDKQVAESKQKLDELLAGENPDLKTVNEAKCEYARLIRNQKVKYGGVLTLDEVRACQQAIVNKYPKYKEAIDSDSGIIYAVEIVRKSIQKMDISSYSIKIDLGEDSLYYEIDPSNFVTYHRK